MVSLGQAHFFMALAALVSGSLVIGLRKGNGIHRLVGFVYAVCMFGVTGSALLIYNLTGEFGLFHVLALVSFATLVLGVTPALIRKPANSWLDLHAYSMSWSYVGLLAATAAETLTRVPDAPFWWAVAIASGMVVLAGWWVINRTVPRTLDDQLSHRVSEDID